MKTFTVESIVTEIARKKGYLILKNKRLLVSRYPRLHYQPDFLLIGRKGKVIVEIELTTDASKSLIGDIVRTGIAGGNLFIGIVKEKTSFRAMEAWGWFLRQKFFNRLEIKPILARNSRGLCSELEGVL